MASVTVSSTSATVAARAPGRQLVVIANLGPSTAFINVFGGDVTPTTNGQPLEIGETITVKGEPASREIKAGVPSGSAELRVNEA